ncbi:MAG: hypothetical protein KatS3mg011_1311 [Acidimicrobiia bacterium]|nr:MAG: hypothetical protein KatS3mg011_1311 [Acidimicrobiia bacterium]
MRDLPTVFSVMARPGRLPGWYAPVMLPDDRRGDEEPSHDRRTRLRLAEHR